MKKILLIVGTCIFMMHAMAQNTKFLYVFTTVESAKPANASRSNNDALNNIFNTYGVSRYFQPFPGAKTTDLNNVFTIYATGNIESLKSSLLGTGLFYRIDVDEFYSTAAGCGSPAVTNDPVSNTWAVDDWAIHMIDAPCAFTVTTGSSNIKIGIVDTEFDLTHEDLSSQIVSTWGTQNTACHHGTIVSGCAAAATNNGKGIMGVGYNSKIRGYCTGSGCSGNPWPGIWQAYLDGCRVINVSWSGIGSYPSILAVQEITRGGAVIVTGAGNSPGANAHSAYATIPGVINVSSVNKDNMHGPSGHAHNTWVDVCAPGVAIASTYNHILTSNSYGAGWGTSFAAPYVSGTAALVLAVNPCLRPADVEAIIKASTDPIADAASFPGTVGTGRLNAYKAVLLAQTYGTTVPAITVNTTWNTDRYVKGDITIEPGATLTINGAARIFMASSAKVIVKQNAKLVVDNATLTSNCMWQGIEVWGNASQHQYTYGSSQLYQGFVDLKNNAVVENANTAVSLGKGGDWQMYYTGGIVQASNTTFRNNSRDIEFLKYQNFFPSNPAIKKPNLSYFRTCVFETTRTLNNGNNPTNHVTMWNVDGVRFFGSRFENSNPSAVTATDLGSGIYTEDANFTLTGCDWNVVCQIYVCCGASPNIFKNLNYGVRAKFITGSQYNYNIDNNTFENCQYNILNEGVDNAIITRNNLTIGKPRFASFWTDGVEFNTGSTFRIEENNFTKDANANSWITLGTWMTNTGMNNTQIYKNRFTNLGYGNYAYLNNRGYNGSTGQYDGLAYFCNTHIGSTSYDIAISATDQNLGGVRQYQGVLTGSVLSKAAGNTFTRSGVNAESDIYNQSPLSIIYAYYKPAGVTSTIEEPLYVTANKVVKVQMAASNQQNTCPTNFGSFQGSGKMESTVANDYRQLYNEHNEAYMQYKLQLAALLDGGNTNGLKDEIENSWNSETGKLRDKLLGQSPYLSTEILKEAVNKGGLLKEAALFEILSANPDGLRDGELIDYLKDKSGSLPEWMIEELKESGGKITLRTSLESAVSYHKAQKDLYASLIAQEILEKRIKGDELVPAGEYRRWVATYQTPHGDYQVVDDFMGNGDYTSALAFLNTIPQVYALKGTASLEFSGLKSLLTIMGNVSSTGRNIFTLTEDEISVVKGLADNGEGIARVRACNLIGFVYGQECTFDKKLPDPSAKKKSVKADLTASVYPQVIASPNPASNHVKLSYTLPEGLEDAQFNVLDIRGVAIYSQNIKGNKGEVFIETNNWAAGTYLYSVKAGSMVLSNQKLVVFK